MAMTVSLRVDSAMTFVQLRVPVFEPGDVRRFVRPADTLVQLLEIRRCPTRHDQRGQLRLKDQAALDDAGRAQRAGIHLERIGGTDRRGHERATTNVADNQRLRLQCLQRATDGVPRDAILRPKFPFRRQLLALLPTAGLQVTGKGQS